MTYHLPQDTNSTTLSQSLQDLEHAFQAERINVLRPQWAALTREGCVIKIEVGRWRGVTDLSLSDIGLHTSGDEGQTIKEVVRPGKLYLLSRDLLKQFASIENKARNRLNVAGMPTYWGRFVTVDKYEELQEHLIGYKDEYETLVAEVIGQLEQLIEEQLAIHGRLARQSYRRLMRQMERTSDVYQQLEAKGEDQFARDYVERIKVNIPSPEHIAAKFRFEINLSHIPLQHVMDEHAATQARIDVEAEKTSSMARLIEYREELGRQTAQQEADAEQDMILIRQRAEQAKLRAAETQADHRQRQLAAMNAAVIQSAQERLQREVDDNLKFMIGHVHGLIYDTCTGVRQKIVANDGKLLGKSASQLRNLLKNLGELNITNDMEVEAMITALRTALGTSADARSVQEVQRVLQDMSLLSASVLRYIGDDRSGLGADNIETVELTTAARKRLVFSETPEIEAVDLTGRGERAL